MRKDFYDEEANSSLYSEYLDESIKENKESKAKRALHDKKCKWDEGD